MLLAAVAVPLVLLVEVSSLRKELEAVVQRALGVGCLPLSLYGLEEDRLRFFGDGGEGRNGATGGVDGWVGEDVVVGVVGVVVGVSGRGRSLWRCGITEIRGDGSAHHHDELGIKHMMFEGRGGVAQDQLREQVDGRHAAGLQHRHIGGATIPVVHIYDEWRHKLVPFGSVVG